MSHLIQCAACFFVTICENFFKWNPGYHLSRWIH